MANRVTNAPNKVLRLLSSDTKLPLDPLLQQRQVIGIYDALDALAQSAFSVVNNVNTFTGSPLAYTTVLANATAVVQERNLNFSSAFSVVDNAPQARTDVALATTGVTPSSYGDSTHVGAFAVDATGRITAANSVAISFPTAGITQLTGDVTAGPGSGSVAATLANIPNDTTAAGDILFTQIVSPAAPAAGKTRLSANSIIDGLVIAKGGGGASSFTTFQRSAVATQFVTGMLAGTLQAAQPAFTDISGVASTAQIPALWTKTPGAIAFIDSTTHLVDNDPNNLFWDNANKRVILGLGGAYTPAAGAPLSIWSSSGNIAIELDQAATQGIAKYNGALIIGTGDANSMALLTNAVHRLDLTATGGAKASNEPVSGGETAWKWDLSGASHTNVSTEVPDILANMSRLVTLTAGTIASMRAFRIDPVTYAGTGASVITDAATLAINGAPSTGAGATITNKWTLWSQGGAAKFDAATGGTSAVFSDGGVNATMAVSHVSPNTNRVRSVSNEKLSLGGGGVDHLVINPLTGTMFWPQYAIGSNQLPFVTATTGEIGVMAMPRFTAQTMQFGRRGSFALTGLVGGVWLSTGHTNITDNPAGDDASVLRIEYPACQSSVNIIMHCECTANNNNGTMNVAITKNGTTVLGPTSDYAAGVTGKKSLSGSVSVSAGDTIGVLLNGTTTNTGSAETHLRASVVLY
jgi:hypothetical protein